MKNYIKQNTFFIFVGLLLIVPHLTEAKINAKIVSSDGREITVPIVSLGGSDITVSISLGSIKDIKGCDVSTCQYWQMAFEKQEEHNTVMYHRYYSSDVFPASQLSATYTFHLPAGEYSGFTLGGYATNKTGNCGWEDYSYVCPDGKHVIADEQPGFMVLNDLSFISFAFAVQDSSIATATFPQPSLASPSGSGNVIAILDVPSPSVATVDTGKVTYSYTVWNVGESHAQRLTDVQVTDDKCSPIIFLAGDLNGNGKLDKGENWEYSCSTTLSESITNTATVIAYSDDIGHEAASATTISTVIVVPEQGLQGITPLPDTEFSSNTAPASDVTPPSGTVLFPDTGSPPGDTGFYSNTGLRRPLIRLEKGANRLNVFIFEGRNVTYTYTVTNPGVVPIHDVVITDNACAPISYASGDIDGNNLLSIHETWVYTCTTTHSGSSRSIAEVIGRANGFTPADVVVTDPGLTFTGVIVLSLLSGEIIIALVFFGVVRVYRRIKHRKHGREHSS